MSNPYQVLEDGSILFDKPLVFKSEVYGQSPDNPLLYIPKFDKCRFRQLEVIVGTCGRKVCRWNCNQLNETINVSICKKCTILDR